MRQPANYHNKRIITRTKVLLLLLLVLSLFYSVVVVVVLCDDDIIISTTRKADTPKRRRRLKHHQRQQSKQKEQQKQQKQKQIQNQQYDSSYLDTIMNHHHNHNDHNHQKNTKEIQKIGFSSNNISSSTTNDDDSKLKFDHHHHHHHKHDYYMEQIDEDDCHQENNHHHVNNNNSDKIMKYNDCIQSTKRRKVEKSHNHNHMYHSRSGNSSSTNNIDNTECFHISPSKDMIENDIILMKQWTKLSSSRQQQPSYYIPVYIHSLMSTLDDDNNINDNYNDIMEYINEQFIQSTNVFTFILQQTTHTINNNYANECFAYMKDYMRLFNRGGAETLNIYFCNTVIDPKTNIQYDAFATMPYNNMLYDGIVIARSKTTNNNVQVYNTLIHEMGHYFGLFHTYSSTCNKQNGDFVNDTPQHLNQENQVNCRTDPSTWDTCPDISGIDPVNNYMTYAPDKLCRTTFTPGQVERMIGQFELYRLNPNINIVPTTPPNNQRPLTLAPNNNNNNNNNKPQQPTAENGSTPSMPSGPIPINNPNVFIVPVRNVCSETQSQQRQCQKDIDCCSGQQCRHKKWWLILGSKICYDRHQWWLYNWIHHWF